MTSLGKVWRHRATWKMVLRSIGSAIFSMVDMGSDIFSIFVYRSRGFYDVANLMTFFVLLSLVLQLLLVVMIHYKNKRSLLFEIFGTLSFTKPAFNKYRVLRNSKAENRLAVVSPITEMIMFKIAEIFAESIPMVSTVRLSKTARKTAHISYKLTRLYFADGAAGERNS